MYFQQYNSHVHNVSTLNTDEKYSNVYKAASEKARAGQGPAGGQSENHSEAEGPPEDSKQSEGPIIDAEVVEEKKAA